MNSIQTMQTYLTSFGHAYENREDNKLQSLVIATDDFTMLASDDVFDLEHANQLVKDADLFAIFKVVKQVKGESFTSIQKNNLGDDVRVEKETTFSAIKLVRRKASLITSNSDVVDYS